MTKRFRRLLYLGFAMIFCVMLYSTAVSAEEADTVSVTVKGRANYTRAFYLLNRINSYRAAEKLDPLLMDNALLETAMLRAAECSLRYSHTRPNGTDYLSLGGVEAEIITAGNKNLDSAREIINSWKKLKKENDYMLGDFKAAGVGLFVKDGYSFWVLLLSKNTTDLISKSGSVTREFSIQVKTADARASLKLISAEKTTFSVGETAQIRLEYRGNIDRFNSVVVENSMFEFSSSAPGVVSVDQSGNVRALSLGSAVVTVTAKSNSAVRFTCQYSVQDLNARSVRLKARRGKFSNGSSTLNIKVVNGKKYGKLESPVCRGYTFEGWYDADGKKVTASTIVSIADQSTVKRLYARWKKVKVSTPRITAASIRYDGLLRVFSSKVSGAKGYQVCVSTARPLSRGNMVRGETQSESRRILVEPPAGGTTGYFYMKVRAWKVDSAGKRVYSKYSALKRVKKK